jgi:pimeloyl-ACP methyl ester carboxylesterase
MDVSGELNGVFFREMGQGIPLIAVHGWTFDHQHMMGALEPCFQGRENWRRIYLDLPGHGRSPKQDWMTSMDDMLQVILTFIDEFIRGERFAIAGMSTGAYLARGVVKRQQVQSAGLLLFAPRIVAYEKERIVPPMATLVKDPDLMSQLGEADAEALQQNAVVQSPAFMEKLRQEIFPAWEAADMDFLAPFWEESKWALSFDVDDLPEPLSSPALIVTGRQDAAVGYRDAWPIIENFPRGTFAVLDRAGHGLEVEQAGLLQVLVSEWLDRVEENERVLQLAV